jgi:hypothetical protein
MQLRRACSPITIVGQAKKTATSGSLFLLEPYGPVQACNGIALPLTLCVINWGYEVAFVVEAVLGADNLTTIISKSVSLSLLEPVGLYRDCFTSYLLTPWSRVPLEKLTSLRS